MIEPGTPAPDFKLRDQDGQEVSLEDLKGQTSVLVFYPLDFSPVCTDQLSIYQELVYLAVSFANECAYCTAAHITSAKKAGVSEEEINALQTEQNQFFSGPERAAILYSRELTREVAANETADELFEQFNDEQIVEITLIISMANFTNRFNNGLGLKPEEE